MLVCSIFEIGLMVDEKKCQLEYSCKYGYTLLHRAAHSGILEIVQYLIEEKAFKPNCEGLKGRTPLHSACLRGRYNVVEYLILKCGVDPS